MFRPLCILASAVATMLVVAGCAETVAARPSPTDVARVCTGVSEAQARAALTDLRGDVERVDLAAETSKTKPFIERAVGVDIHVNAKQGMTAQWLARVVQCHAVNEAATTSCGGSECVFDLPIVSSDVSATATGFTIALRSNDAAVARELARRSKSTFERRPAEVTPASSAASVSSVAEGLERRPKRPGA